MEATFANLSVPEERQLMSSVSTAIGWSLVEEFSRTRREHPDEVRKGAEILLAKLREAGLDPHVHDPEIHLVLPVNVSLTVGGKSFRSKAMAGSPTTPAFEARLIHLPARHAVQRVHTNDPAVLFGKHYTTESLREKVRGKVVLTNGLSNPGRSELLENLGALAVIAINPGEHVHWGASSTVWGSPTLDDLDRLPKIPSLSVANPDGPALIAAAEAGDSVRIEVESLSGWFRQPIPEVRIRGRESDGRFVLMHGHYDSWDVGVGDNATGNAVLLEAARALKACPPKHDVRILWWPGHSAGRYAGSTWYADAFAHELHHDCIVHLNCDSPGSKDATYYGSIRGMAEAQDVVATVVRDLFDQECELERPSRGGDYSFNNLGVSGALLASSMVPPEERQRRGWYSVGGNGGSPTWHTEADTLEVADRIILENDTRLYTLLAARIANADGTVLDYRRPFADIIGRFEECKSAAKSSVDFGIHTQLFHEVRAGIEAMYASLQGSAAAASAFRSLGREIVRLGNGVGDVYNHDPAVAFPILPIIKAAFANPSEDPAARVTLQRGANTLRLRLEGLRSIVSAALTPSVA
nr:M28 family peptidase [uncultured Cupriavidus sp.]